MRVNYERVSVKGYKQGKCVVCGKHCKRTEEFFQTLNPWNKDKNGEPKTREQIYKELTQKVKEWEKAPIHHVKCIRKFKDAETDRMIAATEAAKGA